MYEQHRIPSTLSDPETLARVKALMAVAGARLDDVRLGKRLVQIVQRQGGAPTKSFPGAAPAEESGPAGAGEAGSAGGTALAGGGAGGADAAEGGAGTGVVQAALAHFAQDRRQLPPDNLGRAVLTLAMLGGYLNYKRKQYAVPGHKVMWEGYTRLATITQVVERTRRLNEGSKLYQKMRRE